MAIRQVLSKIFKFPIKPSASKAESNNALPLDMASKLAVLTGYLAARECYSEETVIEMMSHELESRGVDFRNKPETCELVKTGFVLFSKESRIKPGRGF